jgi:hypothetical protein
MIVFDLDFENIEYGYRMEGPFRPEDGQRFDSTKILLDPYARAIGGRDTWRGDPNWDDVYHHRGRLVLDDFDWEGDRPLEMPSGRPHHLRGARPQLHGASLVEGEGAGHLRRHSQQDSVPEGARGQLHRADAGVRVRRVREQPAATPDRRAAGELLGLQHGRLLRAEGRVRRDRPERDAGGRVQDARQGAAPQRHRDHPRRGVQPHRRGQRARADDLVPRARQQDLLHAHARGVLLQLLGHRQHAELQQPDRPQHGARLPALLGGRVSRRRLPLRSGGDSRARSERRAAGQPAAARDAGVRSRCWPSAS